MVTRAQIQEIADRIVAEFDPECIVLFGSHAEGRADTDSDVDLLVVLDFEGPAYKTAAKIRAFLPKHIALDVVARTRADVDVGHIHGDPIVRRALERGTFLHKAAA